MCGGIMYVEYVTWFFWPYDMHLSELIELYIKMHEFTVFPFWNKFLK